MGAEAWDYFVPYEEDIDQALQKLRVREFRAGRYNGAERHAASIDEVLENMDADGTRSILDMTHVAEEPEFFAVARFTKEQLLRVFGTERPTREMIEGNHDLYEELDRGQGAYVIVYKDGKPSEIFFAGYSFD